MDPKPLQGKLSSPDNQSHSTTQSTPVLAPVDVLPSPPKVARTRRPRKKITRTTTLIVDLTDAVQSASSTQATPDSNNNNINAEQVRPSEPVPPHQSDCLSTDTATCGDEKQSLMACSENPARTVDEEKSNEAPLSESPSLPCQQIISCASSTPAMDNPGSKEEPTTFLLPLCENGALPCQQMVPGASQQVAPSCGIPDEPPTFMLPLRERSPRLQRQQHVVPISQPVPGIPPPGFPMKIVHFVPQPHLLPMGQFFGHPPMMAPFQPPPPPMARLMGPPPPSVGHFVGPAHHFLRTPNPASTYFRPVFWDPRNPYGPHPYAGVPTQMSFSGYAAGPQRRRPAVVRPRKPRRKASNPCVVEAEQNAAPLNMDEPLPQPALDEISAHETSTVPETLPENTISLDTPVQETTTDDNLPQETIIDITSPQKTIMDDEFPQGTIVNDPSLQGTITDEPMSPQETVMAFSMDVPDMCNEVEVESTLSLNGEEYAGENGDDAEVDFSRNLSTNLLPPLDLNRIDIDRDLAPLSPTPVKTRRMSQKKDQMKLVFDRKSEAMVKAAKGLFTKRTRTLYTWLYPNTSKREVKTSVSKAWDLLPESEKAYYLAQVDGRLGIHPGLMVNPQLEGLVKLPEGSTAFESRSKSRACAAERTSEDGSSSDYGSSEHSDAENNASHNEVARAVRNLFASNGDVETWTSFAHHEDVDDKTCRRRRKRRKAASSENGNSADDAKRSTGERDAELECELAKFRQILENDNNLNDEDNYWRVVPEPNPEELFLDIMQE